MCKTVHLDFYKGDFWEIIIVLLIYISGKMIHKYRKINTFVHCYTKMSTL